MFKVLKLFCKFKKFITFEEKSCNFLDSPSYIDWFVMVATELFALHL